MKRIVVLSAWLALTAAACWGTYVWGWYRGLSYHAVVSNMSEAKWSLSAARSIRLADPALALELLEANIAWTDIALRFSAEDVPSEQRGNYDIVMQRLDAYRARYGHAGSQ